MDTEEFLQSLVILLVAARIAAELAERLKQPALLGEIIAGICIGPSLLGLVRSSDLLGFLGELGAVLLLFEVGMHLDLPGLRKVGADSLRVAGLGIVAPMMLAVLTCSVLGISPDVSLFVAGALTATSVGITARVFGELRALGSTEARTVLGAAVADDVAGLFFLTLITGITTGDEVSAGRIVTEIGAAVAFLVLATGVTCWAGPRLLRLIAGSSRSDGTTTALTLAFAVALAAAASAVSLAPIVGAFIAGLAVSRSDVREDVQRGLKPLVHLLVPVFFLFIGIRTDIAVFADPDVIWLAGLLIVVAAAGKIASGLGVRRGNASRLLVGVAMIPRGELGLIFAGIGLSAGVLDESFYGTVVAVVLVTTLITPPWMRRLVLAKRRRAVAASTAVAEPPGGWLELGPEVVDLRAEPPDLLALPIGLQTAVLCAGRQPGPWLLQWISSAQPHENQWDERSREAFFALLRSGNARSWRFLQVTGLLDDALPILGEAARKRNRDPFNIEPGADLHWELLSELQVLVDRGMWATAEPGGGRDDLAGIWKRIENPHLVYLAALVASAFQDKQGVSSARSLAQRIGLDEESVSLLEFYVGERTLLPAAARRFDLTGEDSILELAAHIGTRAKLDALLILAIASRTLTDWELDSLRELYDLLHQALSHPELVDSNWGSTLDVKRRQIVSVLSHFPAQEVESHLRSAPRRYLASHGAEVIARHLRMTSSPFSRAEIRLEAEPPEKDEWWTVHVAAQDRRGLLAAITGSFGSFGLAVKEAVISTWRDGLAIDVFRVDGPRDIDWEQIAAAMMHGWASKASNGDARPPIEGSIEIDNLASPWHSIIEITAYDRTGLLHNVASALSHANIQIHMAVVRTRGDVAVDIFYATGRNGGKLDEIEESHLRTVLSGKRIRRLHAPWMKKSRDLEFTKGKHLR